MVKKYVCKIWVRKKIKIFKLVPFTEIRPPRFTLLTGIREQPSKVRQVSLASLEHLNLSNCKKLSGIIQINFFLLLSLTFPSLIYLISFPWRMYMCFFKYYLHTWSIDIFFCLILSINRLLDKKSWRHSMRDHAVGVKGLIYLGVMMWGSWRRVWL